MELNTKPVDEMSMLELETERDEIWKYLDSVPVDKLRTDPHTVEILARSRKLLRRAKILQAGIKNHTP